MRSRASSSSGRAEGDGDKARADHGGAAHEAEDHLEGGGRLHLLAHDKARPALGLGAAEHHVDIGLEEMLEHRAARPRGVAVASAPRRAPAPVRSRRRCGRRCARRRRCGALPCCRSGRRSRRGWRWPPWRSARVRGALEAEPAEDVERCLDQLRAGLGTAVALRPAVGARRRGSRTRLGGTVGLGPIAAARGLRSRLSRRSARRARGLRLAAMVVSLAWAERRTPLRSRSYFIRLIEKVNRSIEICERSHVTNRRCSFLPRPPTHPLSFRANEVRPGTPRRIGLCRFSRRDLFLSGFRLSASLRPE